jgi:hypothetical protein
LPFDDGFEMSAFFSNTNNIEAEKSVIGKMILPRRRFTRKKWWPDPDSNRSPPITRCHFADIFHRPMAMVMPWLRFFERSTLRVRVGQFEWDLEWQFGGPGRLGNKPCLLIVF